MLSRGAYPILVSEDEPCVVAIVPSRYWSKELVSHWRAEEFAGARQRSSSDAGGPGALRRSASLLLFALGGTVVGITALVFVGMIQGRAGALWLGVSACVLASGAGLIWVGMRLRRTNT
jgi:hypothetical protein